MLACYFGSLDTVKLLIQYGANVNTRIEYRHQNLSTPLTFVIRHKTWSIAHYLVKKGADLDDIVGGTKTIWDVVIYDEYDTQITIDIQNMHRPSYIQNIFDTMDQKMKENKEDKDGDIDMTDDFEGDILSEAQQNM